MSHWPARVLVLLCLSVTVPAPASEAVTPETLLRNGELMVSLVVDSQGPLYQRAPLVLAVEIATPRWFSRGTRVQSFTVAGAVVRPVSSFANNQTRRIGGQSWSIQRWRFRIYPQDAGALTLPEITVFVSINTESAGIVEGELKLTHPPLEILQPPGTEGLEHWVATPSLQIDERWEGLAEDYRPGDAITRVRRFLVEDAPAMMLHGSDTADIPGLSLYSAPPRVEDRSNRGALSGLREETLIVTFESPGDYQLEGLDYAWLNTDSGQIEHSVLAPREITVSGSTAPGEEALSSASAPLALRTLLPGGAGLLALLLLWQLGRRPRVERLLQATAETYLLWRKGRAYRAALDRGDSDSCLELLYWRLSRDGHCQRLEEAFSDASQQVALRELLAHAYGKGEPPSRIGAARVLWKALARPASPRRGRDRFEMNPRRLPLRQSPDRQ